jgi:hypothetical protein
MALTLNIPPDIEAMAARRAKEAGYSSLDAYVADLVCADAIHPQLAPPELEKLLSDRLLAPSDGVGDATFFDRLRSRLRSLRSELI